VVRAGDPVMRGVPWGLFPFRWLLVLVSTFLINHFDLFELRQVWLQVSGRPYTHLPFGTLYVGWFFAFWATPATSFRSRVPMLIPFLRRNRV
jgi:hypothetical protein